MITLLRSAIILAFVSAVAAQSISATLEWDPSQSSDVSGYHVYRKNSLEAAYQRLTASPVAGLTFTDSSPLYGQAYSYTATAVSSTGSESNYSNEATLDLICRGDVNADRSRNVQDVIQIQNHIVGNIALQNNSRVAADVVSDGTINVLDAVRLMNQVVGNLPFAVCTM